MPPAAIKNAYDRVVQQADVQAKWAVDDALLGLKADAISGWTIAKHLEHIGLVNRGIIAVRLEDGLKPETPQLGGPSLFGRLVLLTQWIPRGRGQAPDTTVPHGATPAAARESLAVARSALDALQPRLDAVATARGRTPHPRLGMFSPSEWLRFVWIHNHHHEKIIREILTRCGKAK